MANFLLYYGHVSVSALTTVKTTSTLIWCSNILNIRNRNLCAHDSIVSKQVDIGIRNEIKNKLLNYEPGNFSLYIYIQSFTLCY
jgi:hypothetical protein